MSENIGELAFLVDVNLPRFFRFFHSPQFTFVIDLDGSMKDRDIWSYALEHNQIILTKDADFFHRCLVSKERPKVVHFEIGNATLQELHRYFDLHWHMILQLLVEMNYTLVVARDKTIEAIL